MTALTLTFWQARVLLLMTLEPQEVKAVADRIAVRGAVLDLSRVQQLLNELTALSLLEHTPKKGRAGGRYWLAAGPAVDVALDQAYTVVTGNRLYTPMPRQN